ncbi:MAG: fibronectin type III domain-containing protein [Candidatus Margulisbacteria bacterium]|nr:fibronectin type III domain-containing protein [Candidatus Margulisiibacteriota bacterium]
MAENPAGEVSYLWSISGNGTLTNVASANAFYTAPAAACTVTISVVFTDDNQTVTKDVAVIVHSVLDIVPPDAPAGLAVTSRTFAKIVLDWADSPETDLAGYDLYWKKQSDLNFTRVAGLSGSAYTCDGLTASTTYEFYVVAYDNSSNYSPSSSVVSETTDAPPAMPIVYSNGDGNLYLISEDGAYGQTLYAGGNAKAPVWSADKSKIYFIGNDGYVYVLTADSPSSSQKTNTQAAQIFDVTSGKVLYRHGDTTYIADINGDNFTNSAAFIPAGVNGYPVGSACFSPDGTRVAFNTQKDTVNLSLESFQSRAIDENGYIGDVYIANVDGSSPILLLDSYDAYPPYGQIVNYNAVVKDWVGNKILFTSYYGQTSSRVFTVQENGTNAERKLDGTKHWARKFLSSDGAKILFLDFGGIRIYNAGSTTIAVYTQDYATVLAD